MVSPAVSLALVTFTKSPGLAPMDFAAESVERTNGNSCGEALYLFKIAAASSGGINSCLGTNRWSVILNGSSSSFFLALTAFALVGIRKSLLNLQLTLA